MPLPLVMIPNFRNLGRKRLKLPGLCLLVVWSVTSVLLGNSRSSLLVAFTSYVKTTTLCRYSLKY